MPYDFDALAPSTRAVDVQRPEITTVDKAGNAKPLKFAYYEERSVSFSNRDYSVLRSFICYQYNFIVL